MKTKVTRRVLLDFLASKPKEETYNYLDNGNCLFAQFAKFLFPGMDKICAITTLVWGGDHAEELFTIPHGWDRIGLFKPNTFGAAHERARKLFKIEV